MWNLIDKPLRFFIFLTGLLFFQAVNAQRISLNSIEPIDGLEGLHIQQVVFDSKGFMWLRTNDGLYFSDGYFNQKINLSEVDNAQISAMVIDNDQIHLGFQNGVYALFDAPKRKIAQWTRMANVPLSSIIVETQHNIWLGSQGEGLFNIVNDTIISISKLNGLVDNHINDLVLDTSENRLWIATDRGLEMMDTQKENPLIQHFSTTDGLPENWVIALEWDGHDDLFVLCFSGAITQINTASQPIKFSVLDFKDSSLPKSILNKRDDLWIGTDSGELMQYDKKGAEVRSLSPVSNQKAITDLSINTNGQLVALNATSQVFVFNQNIHFIDSLGDFSMKDLSVIYHDDWGNFYYANQNGLYLQARDKTHEAPEKLLELAENNNEYIISLYVDSYQRIWAGTFGQGLWIIDGDKKHHITEKQGLINNSVLSVSGDPQRVWVGTLGGVSVFDLRKSQMALAAFDQSSTLNDQYVYSVFDDAKNVWFGTDGQGIIKYADGNFTTVAAKDHFKSVYSIVGFNNSIWFTSKSGHLNRFSGDTLVSFSIRHESKPVELSKLYCRGDSIIWFIWDKGIGLFNSYTEEYQLFDEDFGLKDFNYNFLNVLSGDSECVYFGLEGHLIKIDYNQNIQPLIPQTHIYEVSLFSNAIDSAQHDFKADKNHFVFRYAGLWYNHPQKVKYRYRLRGFDIDWKYTIENEALYQKLPAGDYVFEVQSSIDEEFEQVTTDTWNFSIRKPFYLQWWFIISGLILTVAIGYGLRQLNERKKLDQTREERDKILTQFELLKTQVNPHFLFNGLNTLKALIAIDEKEANRFLIKLSDYLRVLLTKNESDTHLLGQELELATDYLYLQSKRFGDNLKIEISISEDLKEQTIIPPLTLQILLENAIKHNVISTKKPLHIEIFLQDQAIVVRNNFQPGLKGTDNTGLGLLNIKNRYKILFDRMIVIEQNDRYFQVKLPLIYKES